MPMHGDGDRLHGAIQDWFTVLPFRKGIPKCKRGGAKTPVLRNRAYAVSIFVLGRVRGSDFRRVSVVCLTE